MYQIINIDLSSSITYNMLYPINTRHRKIWGDIDNNRWLQTQIYYFKHLYCFTRYREEVFLCFSTGSFPLQTVIGTRLFDQVCRHRLCQCILICVLMNFVSQATRVSMHLTLKIYSTSFSRFQVMALTHHHTKEIFIFEHHIDVPTKQFEQTSNAEQRDMFLPPLGSSSPKDALTYVNASTIHTRDIYIYIYI